MTGTISSTGKSFFDVDAHRNQEWLRRRKLRLEQVRRQSNEIAKALREKVINHEKTRLDEYDKIIEMKFNKWKAEKLEELEQKLISALEEFGEGYKLAEEEPDVEDIMKEKHEMNQAKAQLRGEIALQEEFKKKKIAEENKMSAIQRKKLIRRKEDLRSALVLSVPVKKQLINNQNVIEEKIPAEKTAPAVRHKINDSNSQKKVSPNKMRRKKSPQKSCKCKKKSKTVETAHNKRGETIWINLNEIQNCTGDSELHKNSKSSGRSEKNPKEKLEKGVVEFYDFSSRYYCKSLKEFPHSVERIEPEQRVLNAKEMAKIDDEMEKAEAKKKAKADLISQERGSEALRKEKINQDFNKLLTKLEDLHRKEKLLKSQQRNLPSFVHMSEERLTEKLKAKQKLMDSKFEKICYYAVSQIPRKDPPEPMSFLRKGEGDWEAANRTSTRLSFSPPCLKLTSPVTPEKESSMEDSFRNPEDIFRKKQLMVNIDATLKEGRELRRAVYESRESTSGGEEREEEKGKENLQDEYSKSGETSPLEVEEKTTRCQESQTEDLKHVEVDAVVERNGDDSLPVSSSTSYKSPPSVIRSSLLRQFLEYLEGVSEAEQNIEKFECSSKCNRKVDEFYQNFMHAKEKGKMENGKSYLSPRLKYYIEKLLNMSRESIADLSVSSENISTPNITDLDVRNSKSSVCFANGSSKGEDLIRKTRLERADHLEKTIRNWKRILEKDSSEHSEQEDVPDCPEFEIVEEEEEEEIVEEQPSCSIVSPKIMTKYEEITKKCSERISELSNMLDRVRKDKEKLLTSGGSSVSLTKDERHSEEEEMSLEESLEEMKKSVVEGFLSRYDLSTPRKETVSTTAVADSQSLKDFEDNSWPDVMDELLKRKILTSPFKWSDGDYSSEFTALSGNQTKPSSIETVIGNFRREISKIKPFTLTDSLPQSKTNNEEKYKPLFCSPKSEISSGLQLEKEKPFQEESSVESINQALTTLGLNWAKSFLRKNEESKAMNSSSNSEGESSGNEA